MQCNHNVSVELSLTILWQRQYLSDKGLINIYLFDKGRINIYLSDLCRINTLFDVGHGYLFSMRGG